MTDKLLIDQRLGELSAAGWDATGVYERLLERAASLSAD